jgi:hypothetical protein
MFKNPDNSHFNFDEIKDEGLGNQIKNNPYLQGSKLFK